MIKREFRYEGILIAIEYREGHMAEEVSIDIEPLEEDGLFYFILDGIYCAHPFIAKNAN